MTNKISTQPFMIDNIFNESLFMRLFSILPAALLMTLFLLYAMYSLVHNEHPLELAKPTQPIPEVTMKVPEYIEIRESDPPVRPLEQLPPPVISTGEPVAVDFDPGLNFRERIIAVKPPIDGNFGVSGQMVSIIRIAPQYPQAAISRGVEGYVDVIFDVTPLGTTENIRIIAAVPSNIFNRSVIKAVSGWKYKPNVVDGVAVKTPDVKDRVRFNMEK